MGNNHLVLLFSFTFGDGAVLTPEAFLHFLRRADRDEVADCAFHFLPYNNILIGEYEYYSDSDIKGALFASWETH